jgi:short-subunit dehydrogenase
MSKYALITGAAKGIGKAIAEDLAKRNYHLLLTDIDAQALRSAAAAIKAEYRTGVQLLVIDLSDLDAAQRLFQWSAPFHDVLSVVVNNAGYGLNAPFNQLPLHQHLDLINVNVRALVSISHLFVPVLDRQTKGWLLNVGSTTSYQTIPFLNTYASSKAFVLSFTRGLKKELQHTNVSVSCLSPGSTDTNFVNRAGMSAKTKKIAERYNMTPENVAEIAIKGLFKGKAEIVPGFTNKLHAFSTKFFPKSFVENIGARIYGPAQIKDTLIRSRFAIEEEDFLTA